MPIAMDVMTLIHHASQEQCDELRSIFNPTPPWLIMMRAFAKSDRELAEIGKQQLARRITRKNAVVLHMYKHRR